MLPINHSLIENAPTMDVAIHDIAHRVEEWRAYQAMYSSLWPRRQPRDTAHPSLQGLRAPLPRTSAKPMVLALEGGVPQSERAMQSCISAGTGRAARLWHQP